MVVRFYWKWKKKYAQSYKSQDRHGKEKTYWKKKGEGDSPASEKKKPNKRGQNSNQTKKEEPTGKYSLVFPEILEGSQHTATRVIRFSHFKGALVKGTIRHRSQEHKMLKLENWHNAVKNQVVNSWPCGLRGGTD